MGIRKFIELIRRGRMFPVVQDKTNVSINQKDETNKQVTCAKLETSLFVPLIK